ncbi:MAG: hypothetical protein AAFO07_31225, partial [Bacteroidota bacterium]
MVVVLDEPQANASPEAICVGDQIDLLTLASISNANISDYSPFDANLLPVLTIHEDQADADSGADPFVAVNGEINVSPASSRSYFVRAAITLNDQTCFTTAEIVITVNSLPAKPEITGEEEECEGMNAMLNVEVPDGTFATWVAVINGPDGSGVFADDEYAPEFVNSPAVRVRTDFGEDGEQLRVRDNAPVGDYEFQVYLTDETTDCKSELSDPFMVTIHPLPEGTIAIEITPICQGDETTLTLDLTVGE